MDKKLLTLTILTGTLSILTPACAAQKPTANEAALRQQIQQLNERVIQLEKQLAQKQVQPAYQPASTYYDIWDPFAELELMHRNMNRMMAGMNMGDVFNPKVDIKESEKEYLITMDIPGMDKDNINVKVENNTLIVSGERSTEHEENQQDKFYRKERSFGHFMRAVPLPDDAKPDTIDAQYNNGVLTVKVGRTANPKPAVQNIKVK